MKNGRTYRRGLNSKVHLAVDAHGMLVRMRVTAGTVSDGSQALELIEGIETDHLLADKGYDSNAIAEGVLEWGMIPVIPSRRKRKAQR